MKMDSLPVDTLNELKTEFENLKLQSSNAPKESFEKQVQQDSASKLDEVLEKLDKNSPDYLKVLAMKASIAYEQAKIYLNLTSFDISKEHLEKGLEMIKEYADDAQITFLHLRIVNYLSYVLSRTGDFEKARALLEDLVNSELKCQPKVYSTEDLFSNINIDETIAKSKVHKLMINNMQMLGWIYGKMGLTDAHADIVHRSLQKELDGNDGDPIQWAIRCCRLASLFLAQTKWENARYHLAACQAVLDPLEVGLSPNPALFRAQADLARVWVNFGLHLFSVSKKSILENIWNETIETKTREKQHDQVDPLEKFTFNNLEVNVPKIPIKEIHTIQEAKELFLHTHKWLKRARLYYTLRDFPIQYVNIILELSELYRFLAFYEKEIDAQYNVHKKRYETLETLSAILKEVRPNCYVAVSVEIIREIIEVQIELMNLNLKKLYNPSDQTVLGEEDLRKRVKTVAEIGSKMEYLCNEHVQDSLDDTDVTDIDECKDDVCESDKSHIVKDSKGDGECSPSHIKA